MTSAAERMMVAKRISWRLFGFRRD